MLDREKQFINTLKACGATFGIGDDGVLLDRFIFASDGFFEGVHFKREWGDLKAQLQKCFFVNLSDIYAMNAIPKYALLTICIPKDFKESKNLAKTIAQIAKENGVLLIGGDTLVGDKLHISLSIIGEKCKKILYRKGIKKGDYLAYLTPKSSLNLAKSQSFGKNIRHLKNALRFNKISKNSRFFAPKLYPKMLLELNKEAKVGMDISDGIFMELSRLSAINKLDFKLLRKKGEWFYSPEEYQMLYAFSTKRIKKAKNLALKHRHNLVIFARAKAGKYKIAKKNWHS
ncbi:thiamine-phosphate kinase [Helicobacter burdigaliensis]|uniref:thiamine-phosphate kinase n=1 Tax=Helicobacter burdigaliensis TaxID=2315334 RepID=UPI000EF70B7A|nr:thiamine-phosphate kinase [Helicobacter burdigaliensis]